jgi:hypothetical protein
MEVHRRLLNTNPGYAAARMAIENRAFAYRRGLASTQRTGIARIPVVVHVVYNTVEQNISDAQVASQIAVLNRDYRGQGTGTPPLPAAFRALAADARIEFELAKIDPQGRPTKGIVRTRTTVAAFATDDAVKSSAKGGADPWPADRFLNLWVCSLAGGVLGYSQLPGGPAATDGVVVLYSAFGTIGTATAPFNLGRTTTHEIGHWLNLLHVWGDDGTGCNGDDHVPDTPNQAGPNFGVPGFPHITCNNGPHGDVFVNFMDYTDDVCMQMFTAGQVERMDATLDGPRAVIIGQQPTPEPEPGPGPEPEPEPTPQPVVALSDVLFYDRAEGAADLYTFDEEGSPSLLHHFDSWRTAWDGIGAGNLTGTNTSEFFFYDRETGETELYAVDSRSTFSLMSGHEWRPNWDSVAVGTLTGDQAFALFYSRTNGTAELHRLDANGNLVLIREYDDWRTTWDCLVAGNLTGGNRPDILFYDKAAGEAELYSVDASGTFSFERRFTDLGTNWDLLVMGNLTGSPTGHNVLLYDRRAGDAVLQSLSGDGTLSVVRRFTGWRTSWDIVVAGSLSSGSERVRATLVNRFLRRLAPPPAE